MRLAGELRNCLHLTAAVMLGSLVLSIVPTDPRAQTTATAPSTDAAAPAAPADAGGPAADEEAAAEPAYSEEELDELVAPIALYPDALVAQVLVASTYPLDLVKANRWIEKNEKLEGEERTKMAQSEGWDTSVAVLAAGFPTVVARMSDEIDWTEQLGEAMLVQDTDVLDAVQRQRARAASVGNLASNQAQNVTVEGDNITITPAEPTVVYVPQYNPQTVYTQQAAAAPVVTEQGDTGYSSGELLATGVIAFGAGMLVSELFDDDDDDWNGYWGGPPPMNWNGGSFNARPDINVDGDVNINVDRRPGSGVNRPGNVWRPQPKQTEQARQKIADRKGVSTTAATRPGSTRPAATTRDSKQVSSKLAARSGDSPAARRPESGAAKAPPSRAGARESALAGSKGGLTETSKAAARGKASTERAGPAAERQKVSRPAAAPASRAATPKARAAPKSSAFEPRGDGNRSEAARSRGSRSGDKAQRRTRG